MVQHCLLKTKFCRKWLFGLSEVFPTAGMIMETCVGHVTQGAARCHSHRLRAVFTGAVVGILVISTTFTLLVQDQRSANEQVALERDINIAINGSFWVEVVNPEQC